MSAPHIGSAPEPHKRTILIIDDEDYVADMIATVLRIDGYITYVAYNGREGLEAASRQVVDLLIVDIMMPYLNGIDLVDQLRSRSPEIPECPVILMSAGAQPDRTLSNVLFLPKPFEINELIELVVQIIGPGASS